MKESCTVINQYYDSNIDKDIYVSTIIDGIFWEDIRSANLRPAGGMEGADNIFVVIPFSASYSKPFKPPQTYILGPEGSWTLRPGDYIIKGSHRFNFSIMSIKDIENKVDFVHLITKVDTKDFGSKHMQHWEVGGK